MSPEEFWRITPMELRRVQEAHGISTEQQQWLLAWHAANVMSIWSASGVHITASQLMGHGSVDATAVASTPEELAAVLAKREAEANPFAGEEYLNV